MYVFHRTKKLYLWLTAVLVLSFSTVTWSQKTKYPMNDHPNPYRTINGYFDLPGDRTWGATGAIDIAPDGESIWVAERCGTNSCAGSYAVRFTRSCLWTWHSCDILDFREDSRIIFCDLARIILTARLPISIT